MDVRDFVSSTIDQVMQAVSDSQTSARALGGYVNPTAHTLPKEGAKHIGLTATGQAIFMIDFDIAVTIGAESGADGGAKLQVASIISVGAKGRVTDKSESTSRVRFAVPVTLPVDTDSNEEREARNKAAADASRRVTEQIAARNRRSIGDRDWRR